MFVTEFMPWILLGVAAIAALTAITVFSWPLRRTGSYSATPRETPPESSSQSSATPKASVIVYSHDPEYGLMDYLESLTGQDYPSFEIIVVCESTAESTEMLAESCSRRFPDVYFTFIPPGSHNLSRRKLALTLGMKAASGELVVTTVSNASIPSQRWLSSLLAPFSERDDTDVSLGYSRPDYTTVGGAGRWYREFIDLLTDAQWIGFALSRKPYRGDGFNLAFRRRLFFEHKGYSKSIYLHSGDDDLFINEIATPENTAAVLDPESILLIEWQDAGRRMWRIRKEQYAFTSHWLPRRPFRLAGVLSAMQWIVLLCCAGCALAAWPSPEVPAYALLLLLAFWQTEIIIYRRAAAKMKATRLWWALPLFWLLKAPLNFIFKIRHYNTRRKNFTWQRN